MSLPINPFNDIVNHMKILFGQRKMLIEDGGIPNFSKRKINNICLKKTCEFRLLIKILSS